ncbi:hypothetical protein PHISCL_11238, partial [Aspergillus sclerotialis]
LTLRRRICSCQKGRQTPRRDRNSRVSEGIWHRHLCHADFRHPAWPESSGGRRPDRNRRFGSGSRDTGREMRRPADRI